MSLSAKWTEADRLYVIAACAKVVIDHIAHGGTYGEMGMPNMETIRDIVVCGADDLEAFRSEIEDVAAQAGLPQLAKLPTWNDEVDRLSAIAACATLARDHAMGGGRYGAPGFPTMETILLLAAGSEGDVRKAWPEIQAFRSRAKLDLRSGREALEDTVVAVDRATGLPLQSRRGTT